MVSRAPQPVALALAVDDPTLAIDKRTPAVSLGGANRATAGIVILNEATGKSVVLSGFSATGNTIKITPLLIAELKEQGLGNADTFKCLLVDNVNAPRLVAREVINVSGVTDQVKMPVFNYGPKEAVKRTTISDRRLVSAFQMTSTFTPANDSPEALAEVARLTQESLYDVYVYEVTDGSLRMYELNDMGIKTVFETLTIGDFSVDLMSVFTEEQKSAVRFACQKWSEQLAASPTVPIKIELGFQSFGGNTLGQANTSGGLYNGKAYALSLVNHKMGYDTAEGSRDMMVNSSSDYAFSYATNGVCAADTSDYVTVLMHEIAHGLGFTKYIESDGSYSVSPTTPCGWAEYLYSGGSLFTSMTDAQRSAAMTGGALYWNGPLAKGVNGGSRIQMFAPSPWQEGSSVAHWDFSVTFPTLMKASINGGEYYRSVNDHEAKLLQDIGWTLNNMSSIAISGPSKVISGLSVPFTGIGTFVEGSTTPVSPTWSLSSTTYATISADGVLTAKSVTGNQTVTVNASYTHNGTTLTTSKVVTIVLPISLADGLDTTGLTWTTGGSTNWYTHTALTHDGEDAAQSGVIGMNQMGDSWLQTTVTGPGTITFWWKVSCEGYSSTIKLGWDGWNYLNFEIGGVETTRIAGSPDWEQKSYAIGPGTTTLKWGYNKYGSANWGGLAYCGWVDQVVWAPDVPRIVTDQASVTVGEGSTTTFQVKLSMQPAATTTVAVTKVAGGDADISVTGGASLSFTTSDWNTYKTVTLSAAQDNADAANGTATIACSASGLTTVNVTATEADNDTTLTVTAGTGGSVSPSGATVVTKGAATSISATANSGYSFANWTYTSGSATFANANSASTTATISAPATIQANFTANTVAIVTSTSSVSVPEGSTATFQVKLSIQPAATTTVAVTKVAGGDADISVTGGASLSFTTSDWNTYKTVTLSAAQDNADAANGTATIACSATGLTTVNVTATEADNETTLTVAAGTGGTTSPSGATVVTPNVATSISATALAGYTFANWTNPSGTATFGNANAASTTATISAPATVQANFTANTVAIVTSTSSVSVNEGFTATFLVKLSAQPTGNKTVTVARNSGDTDISVTGGASLTFTTADWDTYKTVTLTAAQDNSDVANGSTIIACSSTGLTTVNVTATEVDNDTTLTVNAGTGGTTSPSGATVVPKGTATSISATPSSGYTFANWTYTSGSATFANANAASTTATISAPATIQANFTLIPPSIIVNTNSLVLTEGSGSQYIFVRLSAQPAGDTIVTSTRSSGDTNILVTYNPSITFTRDNWFNDQLVGVGVQENADMTNGTATITSSSSGYASASVAVTEIDNDGVLTMSASAGGSVSPSGAIPVTLDYPYLFTVTPATGYYCVDWTILSGTATIYNNIMVGKIVGATISTTSTVSSVRANFAANVVAVILSANSVSVNEGSTSVSSPSSGFRVKLSAQPTATKTVTVTRSSGDTDLSVTTGASLTFTTSNWNTFQPVKFTAAEDNGDNANGSAVFAVAATGVTSANVTVTEIDDDYTLTITAVNGTVTKSPNQSLYDSGTGVQLTAVPTAGCSFLNWSGAYSTTANPIFFEMFGNTSLTANFSAPAPLRISNLTLGASTVGVNAQADTGMAFCLQRSTNLVDWVTVGNYGAGAALSVPRTPSLRTCFYRLQSFPVLVENGGALPAKIEEPGDVDWYRLDVTVAGTYTIDTVLGTLTDTMMTLYGPNSQSTVITSNDDHIPGSDFAARISMTLNPGTYYVKIVGYSQLFGSYSIIVTR